MNVLCWVLFWCLFVQFFPLHPLVSVWTCEIKSLCTCLCIRCSGYVAVVETHTKQDFWRSICHLARLRSSSIKVHRIESNVKQSWCNLLNYSLSTRVESLIIYLSVKLHCSITGFYWLINRKETTFLGSTRAMALDLFDIWVSNRTYICIHLLVFGIPTINFFGSVIFSHIHKVSIYHLVCAVWCLSATVKYNCQYSLQDFS